MRHKRDRSLQDTAVDLTEMRSAMTRLAALQEELSGIEETEAEMEAVMKHVEELEVILRGAKKPKVSFSTLSRPDICRLGVLRGLLVFQKGSLKKLISEITPHASREIQALQTRILEIYQYVNMDAGSRMILDAVLLSMAKISSLDRPDLSVAIFPEMRIVPEEGVQVTNPTTSHEVWLTGQVDYAVCQYQNDDDTRARLLGPENSRDDVFSFAKGRFFLVEAKRQDKSLVSHMPEAIGQAIALAHVTHRNETRFCLSNGKYWIFCILRREDTSANWTCYESTAFPLTKEAVTMSDDVLHEIVQLTSEWLVPTKQLELYTLASVPDATDDRVNNKTVKA